MVKKSLPTVIVLSYIGLIIANLIWAAAGPVIKLTIESIPPFTFLFLRFLLVCLLLLPYTILEVLKNKVQVSDYWKIFLLGIFSQSSIIFIVFGLKYTTAVDAAILSALGVLLSVAAGHYFFNEDMRQGVKAGLVISIIGSVIVILEPILSDGHSGNEIPASLRVWGNVLVFLNNLAFLLYIIWSKISFGQSTNIIKRTLHFLHIRPMESRYPASLLTAISFYVGMFSMLPFALLENAGVFGHVEYNLGALSPAAIGGLLYMALFSSIVAYFLFEWSLGAVSIADTAVLGYVASIFGIPFAYWLLGEIPTFYSLLGGAIIGLGVIITEISMHHHKKTRLAYGKKP